MSQESQGEVLFTTKAYRPWKVQVPIVLNTTRFPSANTPEWVSIRAANVFEAYLQDKMAAGEPFLTGFINCQLLVVPGVRGGVLTVTVSNNTVQDAGVTFAKPGGLQAELNRIAVILMRAFAEREAIVECHGMVTHLELSPTRAAVSK